MKAVRKYMWSIAIMALLIGSISCTDNPPSGLQEDRNAPIARVANVAEGDTLQVEYNDSGNQLEFEFLDETQLASYNILIGTESGSIVDISEEAEGTQVFELVNISMLQQNSPYTATLNVQDAAGNSSSLTFVLIITYEEPVEIIYEEIYMVGDATPGGWSLEAQTPLTPSQNNPNIFSWTGELTTGEFKFKVYEANDFCGGEWIHPTQASANISSTDYVILEGCATNNPDHKWVVTEEETGNYSITINLKSEIITIESQ